MRLASQEPRAKSQEPRAHFSIKLIELASYIVFVIFNIVLISSVNSLPLYSQPFEVSYNSKPFYPVVKIKAETGTSICYSAVTNKSILAGYAEIEYCGTGNAPYTAGYLQRVGTLGIPEVISYYDGTVAYPTSVKILSVCYIPKEDFPGLLTDDIIIAVGQIERNKGNNQIDYDALAFSVNATTFAKISVIYVGKDIPDDDDCFYSVKYRREQAINSNNDADKYRIIAVGEARPDIGGRSKLLMQRFTIAAGGVLVGGVPKLYSDNVTNNAYVAKDVDLMYDENSDIHWQYIICGYQSTNPATHNKNGLIMRVDDQLNVVQVPSLPMTPFNYRPMVRVTQQENEDRVYNSVKFVGGIFSYVPNVSQLCKGFIVGGTKERIDYPNPYSANRIYQRRILARYDYYLRASETKEYSHYSLSQNKFVEVEYSTGESVITILSDPNAVPLELNCNDNPPIADKIFEDYNYLLGNRQYILAGSRFDKLSGQTHPSITRVDYTLTPYTNPTSVVDYSNVTPIQEGNFSIISSFGGSKFGRARIYGSVYRNNYNYVPCGTYFCTSIQDTKRGYLVEVNNVTMPTNLYGETPCSLNKDVTKNDLCRSKFYEAHGCYITPDGETVEHNQGSVSMICYHGTQCVEIRCSDDNTVPPIINPIKVENIEELRYSTFGSKDDVTHFNAYYSFTNRELVIENYSQMNEIVSLELVNVIGMNQSLGEISIKNGSKNIVPINSSISNGTYIVKIKKGDVEIFHKLIHIL
ncbi:MAG: hypothetical protein JST20_05865 [Bacteroidetes bacterium]|nr:hypothetical protein [Bacteroidota bacterium]